MGASQERVSLYMSSEMKEFYVSEAEKAGISLSGYIGFILKQHMEEKKDKEMIRRFEGLLEMFGGVKDVSREEMEESIDSIKILANFIQENNNENMDKQLKLHD